MVRRTLSQRQQAVVKAENGTFVVRYQFACPGVDPASNRLTRLLLTLAVLARVQAWSQKVCLQAPVSLIAGSSGRLGGPDREVKPCCWWGTGAYRTQM